MDTFVLSGLVRKRAELRDRRSSLATMTGHFLARPAASAAASCGRRSRASAPFPDSASTNSAVSSNRSASAKRVTAVRWGQPITVPREHMPIDRFVGDIETATRKAGEKRARCAVGGIAADRAIVVNSARTHLRASAPSGRPPPLEDVRKIAAILQLG